MPESTPSPMLLRNESDARDYVRACSSDSAIRLLDILAEDLRAEVLVQNLISTATIETIWLRHIADSAQLIDHVSRETSPWIDLGSGAGFPGLVISAIQPDREMILVESRALRVRWLEGMISKLGLRKCRVVGRDVVKMETIEARVISARAFAPLPRLVKLSARFSTNATEWVLPKGRSAAQDIASLPEALQTRFHVKQSVTDAQAGIIIGLGRMTCP